MPASTLRTLVILTLLVALPNIAFAGDYPTLVVGNWGMGRIDGKLMLYLGKDRYLQTPVPALPEGPRWDMVYSTSLYILMGAVGGRWLLRRRRPQINGRLVGILLFATFMPMALARADETSDAFLAIWKQQADQPNTAAAWHAFAAKDPSNDLAWSARLLQGEDLLRQGNAKAALKIFEAVANDPAATSTEPHRLVAKAAQGLIAWAKMSLLAAKLQSYYKEHVEYPASLDDLLAAKLTTEADMTDPFGSRFVYVAMERETFPGEPRQKFTLACPTIHAQLDDLESTLDTAKAAPKGITLSATDPKNHNAHLAKARPDGSMPPPQRMTVGQELNSDFTLWAIYDGYVVIGWRQFPVVVVKE